MRFALFFAFIALVLVALGRYVHRRASELLRLGQLGRRLLAGVLATGILMMIAARLGRGAAPADVLRVVGVVGSTISLSVIISGILLGVTDLGRLLVRLGRAALKGGLPGLPAAGTSRPAVERAVLDKGGAAARGDNGAAARGDGSAAARGDGSAAARGDGSAAARGDGSAAEAAAPAAKQPDVPRRAFLAQGVAGSALLIGGGSSLYGALFGRHDYVIEEVAVRIPGLPRALDGFSIVQLSDIHLGLFVNEPEMRAAEELVRKARGDLIVMTGDLIDFDPAYADHLGRLTRRLAPLAREGVTAIPGNHDHFAGIDRAIDALTRGGADVLRNRGRVVGGAGAGFALLGVDDVWARRLGTGGGPDLGRALADVPRDLPRVLLCHNPVFFPEAAGEVALQLSGHTHGGQVNVLVRPADWVLPHGYVAGLYQRGESHLYINRGFGTAGPPARVGAPPEVSRIVLVSA